MAVLGDPASRPAEMSAIVASTSAMEEELACLSSCAVVACPCRDQDDIEPDVFKRGFYNRFGVL